MPWYTPGSNRARLQIILCVALCQACASAPLVNSRGGKLPPNQVQTLIPQGGLKSPAMRQLGPGPAPPPERLSLKAQRRPQKTIYTSNPQDCPAGMVIGYGDQNFMGTDRRTFHARGVGAPPPKYYTPQQRRLLTMRAAQLDAMRNLTEQVYGMQVTAHTTIGDMIMENDQARVMVDHYIKGAFVILGTPYADGSYETIVQLTIVQPMLMQLRDEAMKPRCVFIEDLVK